MEKSVSEYKEVLVPDMIKGIADAALNDRGNASNNALQRLEIIRDFCDTVLEEVRQAASVRSDAVFKRRSRKDNIRAFRSDK
jgi:hypothetical protein